MKRSSCNDSRYLTDVDWEEHQPVYSKASVWYAIYRSHV